MIRDPSNGEVSDLPETTIGDPDEPVEEEPEVAFLDFEAARQLINRRPDGPEAA